MKTESTDQAHRKLSLNGVLKAPCTKHFTSGNCQASCQGKDVAVQTILGNDTTDIKTRLPLNRLHLNDRPCSRSEWQSAITWELPERELAGREAY